MLALQEELTSTENKVAFARQAFNDAVTVYNTEIAEVPEQPGGGHGRDSPRPSSSRPNRPRSARRRGCRSELRRAPAGHAIHLSIAPWTSSRHQETARRKTGLLIVYFISAVVLIVVLVYSIVAGAILLSGSREAAQGASPSCRSGTRACSRWWSLGTLALIGGGSLYRIASLAGGGHTVAEMMGGRPLSHQTTDPDERKILNVVEEMAIASGTPVPPVYLLEHEDGINAFAAGSTPGDAVIGVTRGCIQNLTRDELQGVIAHEFSHILNGDMRLNLRLIGVLYGILLISLTGWIIFRSTADALLVRGPSRRRRRGVNPWPLVGLALYVLGYVGVFFGNLIKAAVSRQREFLADASAVQFTRNPDGIAGALKKIGALAEGSQCPRPRGPGGQPPVLRRRRRPFPRDLRHPSPAGRADPPHRSLVRRRLFPGPRELGRAAPEPRLELRRRSGRRSDRAAKDSASAPRRWSATSVRSTPSNSPTLRPS